LALIAVTMLTLCATKNSDMAMRTVSIAVSTAVAAAAASSVILM